VNYDLRSRQGNQFFDAAAGAEEAVDVDGLELLSELEAAGAVLSDGFAVSPPDLASLLPFAEAGFAEE
jgi:hypothetical protein